MSITPPDPIEHKTGTSTVTWFGTQLDFVQTISTKHYYVPTNQSGNAANEIYYDTSDNTWNDSGGSNPFAFRVGAVGQETPAESALAGPNFKSDTVADGDNVLVYRESPVAVVFTFTQPSTLYAASGGQSGGGGETPSDPSTNKKVYHNFW